MSRTIRHFSGKYYVNFGNFSGNYHVKLGHFVNFSYVYFRAKMSCPPPPPKVNSAPTPMEKTQAFVVDTVDFGGI